MTAVRILAGLLGIVLVTTVIGSAIRTVVIPRADPVRLTRVVFLVVRSVFDLLSRLRPDYVARDRLMARYAPYSLLMLPVVWVTLIIAGYTAIFWSLENQGLRDAFVTSGSSMLTLGWERPPTVGEEAIAFSEALLGLGVVTLMLSYLPTIYGAFARREQLVTLLHTYAGAPASAVTMFRRHATIGGLDRMQRIFAEWQLWFADVEESHSSSSSLVFFRSPDPDRSWITSAGCVLDSAALMASTVKIERGPDAELCLRAGYLALRRIAGFFGIPNPSNPAPTDPISVTRAEYDAVCVQLREAGVPLVDDMDQAWRDFAGWRVNYDATLIALCALTVAPPAIWSSDRAPAIRRPPVLRTRPHPD